MVSSHPFLSLLNPLPTAARDLLEWKPSYCLAYPPPRPVPHCVRTLPGRCTPLLSPGSLHGSSDFIQLLTLSHSRLHTCFTHLESGVLSPPGYLPFLPRVLFTHHFPVSLSLTLRTGGGPLVSCFQCSLLMTSRLHGTCYTPIICNYRFNACIP